MLKILQMHSEISNVINATHLAWHEEALQLGRKVGVIPSVPRQCGRQNNRDNIPAEDSETIYRRTLTIPFLDQLVMEMNVRFSDKGKLYLG